MAAAARPPFLTAALFPAAPAPPAQPIPAPDARPYLRTELPLAGGGEWSPGRGGPAGLGFPPLRAAHQPLVRGPAARGALHPAREVKQHLKM